MLEDIKSNITKLIALYETEKQRADTLESKVKELEVKTGKYKEQIVILNKEIDNLKLAGAICGNADKAVMNERINKLIREIDRCINLLEG